VAEVPQYLTLKRNRDLVGRERRPWSRRVLLALVAAIPVAGLAGAFGQQAVDSVASAPAATLRVEAADRLRGGLLGQDVFRIDAHTGLKHATLVLDSGWFDSIQLNTVIPNPLAETDRNGRLALDFGHVPAGSTLVVHMQFQVNPTNVGSHPQGVELDDGQQPIVRIHRTLVVFP
jgi:hypothetical protein